MKIRRVKDYDGSLAAATWVDPDHAKAFDDTVLSDGLSAATRTRSARETLYLVRNDGISGEWLGGAHERWVLCAKDAGRHPSYQFIEPHGAVAWLRRNGLTVPHGLQESMRKVRYTRTAKELAEVSKRMQRLIEARK
jgi:hypothetical protein